MFLIPAQGWHKPVDLCWLKARLVRLYFQVSQILLLTTTTTNNQASKQANNQKPSFQCSSFLPGKALLNPIT